MGESTAAADILGELSLAGRGFRLSESVLGRLDLGKELIYFLVVLPLWR